MKLILFGATGSLGRTVLTGALAAGHDLRAFTRSPDKLAGFSHDHLEIYPGDVLDVAAVRSAVRGRDAVLCTLGDGRAGTVRAAGTQNILEAMQSTGVERLLCQSTLGMGDSYGNLNFLWKHILFGWYLKRVFTDHTKQEDCVMQSHTAYTLIRSSAFTDGPAGGAYKVDFPGSYRDLTLKISRADVATFMLAQLDNVAYVRRAVSISC